ncbi:MAG: ABC transporter ATP-binding protein [Proteobacteria bacterium]|nr:ABC transporter ATP-binding protein [Pseudomonadota bacterium]
MVEARDLGVTYRASRGPVAAIERLSMTLGQGEFVSVVGPSGCGKSTLIKVFSGLLAPSCGSVTFRGSAIDGPRPDVGMVFQQATLLPWKTVLANVLVPARALKLDRRKAEHDAEELLRLVGLSNFAKHYPSELSGGMQQRVGIARGLIHDPALLLMDEPFSALDTMTRDHMSLELQRIWMAKRKSALFITHSIPEAVFLSDRVLVMSARPGRIIRELRIELPRPRDLSTLVDPRFTAICSELRQLFEQLVHV